MNTKLIFILSLYLLVAASCSKKEAALAEPAPAISGLDAEYYILVNDSVLLNPTIENRVDSVVWVVDGQRSANARQYTFHAPAVAGTHSLLVMAYNSGNITQKVLQITTGLYANYAAMVNTIVHLTARTKFEGKAVKWEVITAPSALYRLADSTAQTALFTTVDRGTYQLRVSSGELVDTVMVTVKQPEQPQSPYTKHVFDYLPAPGQFVNILPKYNAGDTYETMVGKAAKVLVGEEADVVTLGGWGGYVVIGFDHTIVNVADRRDFRILGNAFGANANPRPNAPFGGSCEPGIIMVAYDKNKNGKPDEDEWYEIKGSGNFSAEKEPWYSAAVTNGNDVRTFRDYEMTYNRPAIEVPVDSPTSHISINDYIRWTDNQGQEGYKVKNTFHAQSYYPGWVKEDKIVFKGIRLAGNSIDESKQGSYFVQYAFSYGYVDNYPNAHDNTGIDIDWAIDKEGNKANLPGIDFVKVYNGVDQDNGWLGESSTEVGRGEDLHMLGLKISL